MIFVVRALATRDIRVCMFFLAHNLLCYVCMCVQWQRESRFKLYVFLHVFDFTIRFHSLVSFAIFLSFFFLL